MTRASETHKFLDTSDPSDIRELTIFGNAAACSIPLDLVEVRFKEDNGLIVLSQVYQRNPKKAKVVFASLAKDGSSDFGVRADYDSWHRPRTPEEAEFMSECLALATEYAKEQKAAVNAPASAGQTAGPVEDEGAPFPICPFCGAAFEDALDSFSFDEVEEELLCANCDTAFLATAHTTYRYTSRAI